MMMMMISFTLSCYPYVKLQ